MKLITKNLNTTNPEKIKRLKYKFLCIFFLYNIYFLLINVYGNTHINNNLFFPLEI